VDHQVQGPFEAEYGPREVVRIRRAEPPFALSVFMVFILPLILMAGFPLVLAIMPGEWAQKPGYIGLAGMLGLAAAFAVNFAVDRGIRRRFPATITRPKD
jgi:hypothetical protein